MNENKIIIKGMNDWKQNFTTDFTPGDRVTEEIHEHFLNVLPPVRDYKNYMQAGGAYGFTPEGKNTYLTFKRDSISWVYLGTCGSGEDVHYN